jgi:hypothetical protein
MHAIERFHLERNHRGIESSGQRSRLFVDNKDTGLTIAGSLIRYQFETPATFIVITARGAAFNEAFVITLFDRALTRVVAEHTIVTGHYGGWLRDVFPEDENRFVLWLTLDGCDQEDVYYRASIRAFGIPLIRPRIGVRRLAAWRRQRAMQIHTEPGGEAPKNIDEYRADAESQLEAAYDD